jgi:hypothetical protein
MANSIQQEKQLRELAKMLDEALRTMYPERMGFALIVFEFHKPGISDYVSNAEREQMVTALRESADRLEKREDIPPAIGVA